MDEKQIKRDRLRFTKNSLSSGLTYLAILFNVLYFVNIYRSDVGNYYYTWLTGVSIIYNLLFLLTAFLCSEGVKRYHLGYSLTLLVLGALQFARIFVIPKKAAETMINVGGVEEAVMSGAQHTLVVTFLLVSGGLCIIAGVTGIIKSCQLKSCEAHVTH